MAGTTDSLSEPAGNVPDTAYTLASMLILSYMIDNKHATVAHP